MYILKITFENWNWKLFGEIEGNRLNDNQLLVSVAENNFIKKFLFDLNIDNLEYGANSEDEIIEDYINKL